MTFPSIAHWFFQSPWMLLALFSLLIPLIIHLLSKSKGKLVPFGNIKLIKLSKPVKMNEIRLVERFLLLCRLLLLFFSVLLLAQLYYDDRSNDDGAIEGNILITSDWLNNATETELQRLTLKANAVPTYLLSSEPERLTGDRIFTWHNTETDHKQEAKSQNTWLLVNNYAKTLPDNVNITIYSTNRLSQFIGDKIYLPDNITWQIKRLPEDTVTESINTFTNKTLSVVVVSDNNTNEYLPAVKAALSIIQATKLEKLTFTFQLTEQLKNEQRQRDQPEGKKIQTRNNEKYDAILYLSSSPIPTVIKHKAQTGITLIADIVHAQENDVTHIVNWGVFVTKITFPSVLMSLLLDEPIQYYRMQQQLSDEQITSQLMNEKSVTSASLHYKERYAENFKSEFINQLLIILLVVFWSVERLLSEKLKKNQLPSKLNEVLSSNNSNNSNNSSHSSDPNAPHVLRGKSHD